MTTDPDQTRLEEVHDPVDSPKTLLELIKLDPNEARKTEHLQVAGEWRKNKPEKFLELKSGLKEIEAFKKAVGLTEWEKSVIRQAKADKKHNEEINEALAQAAANDKAQQRVEIKFNLDDDIVKRHTHQSGKVCMSPLGIVYAPNEPTEIVLTNFSAIVKHFVIDHRTPDEKSFEIEAIVNEQVYTFILPGKHIERCDWVWTALEGHGRLINASPRERNLVWNTILEASYPITKQYTFGKTGWYIHNGERMYLHAGGAIGGLAKVELPTDIFKYFNLPPAHTGEALFKAIEECIALFTLGNNSQPALTWPLFSTPWAAAMGHRSIVNVQAEQQSGKSTVVSFAQNFFGTKFWEQDLPVWIPNATALGALLTVATIGDAIVVVDDVLKTGNQKVDGETLAIVNRIVRAVFGNSGRLKGSKESKAYQDPTPRSLIILTSEVIPTLNSLLGRQVILRLNEKLISKKQVDVVQDKCKAGVYAGTMAAFIEWIIPQWDELQARKRQRTRSIRDELIEGGANERTSEELAAIAFGLDIFLMFAVDVGAITEDAATQLWLDAKPGFVATTQEQIDTQHREDICTRFLEIVASLLQSCKVSLSCVDSGVVPPNCELWGWRRQSSASGAEYIPASNRIGFIDPDKELVYLNCDDVIKEVEKYGLPVTKAELPNQLYKRELLAKVEHSGEGDNATVKSKLVRVRVKHKGRADRPAGYLCLQANKFVGVGEDLHPSLGLANAPKSQDVESNGENHEN